MIPLLLDALTMVFIVAGLILLWLNLRERWRRKVRITPEEHAQERGSHGLARPRTKDAGRTVD
jgi:hypothetical protein